MAQHRAARGFTLVELLITLIVIGVIASVAWPAFSDSIRKSRRSEAYASLSAIQQAQERWRSNHAAYATDLTATGLNLPSTTPAGYYTLAIDTGADAVSYSVTATATTGMSQAADTGCVRLRVRAASGNLFYGSAAATGTFDETVPNRCWSR